MKTREAYCSELTHRISYIAGNKKELQKYSQMIVKKHNMPMNRVIDFLTLRLDISAASEEELFAVSEAFDIDVKDHFEEEDIKTFSKWKYKQITVPKQFEFEMIQIAYDQWIGKTSVKELMKFRDMQIINYNENTQRVMKRINKGTEEIYAISLNKKAIASMEELFRNGTYISNTITLNMPTDTNYTYNNGILTIKNLKRFDITDGYHRYIAMSNLYNQNNDFDYPMELRITNYSEERSRLLIWQEDQKTKMSRIDSNSMNLNSAANMVAQRLNTYSSFLMTGMINNNGGLINASELAEIIRATYFPVSKVFSKVKEIETTARATREISAGINEVVTQDTSLLTKHWSRYFLYCLIYNISKEEPLAELLKESLRMSKEAEKGKMFVGREIRTIDMKKLAEIRKKGGRK